MYPIYALHFTVFLSFLPSVVVGHGYIAFVTVGSTTYKQNAPRAQATPAATRQVNDVGPVKGASNPDLGCGLAQNPSTQLAQQTIHVNPGDKMAFDWRGGDLSHWPHNTGPMMTYLADCGREGCEKFDSTKAKWFKIQQVERKKSGNMDWAQQDLMNGGTAVVTVPNIAPGNYLIRHEIIALHLAVSQGGAEFYPSCTQIVVGGNETGRPQSNELVSFPGAYRDNDPGLFDPEVYDPNAPYTFPGPPIVAFVPHQDDSPTTSGSTSTPPRSESGSCRLKKRSVVKPRHLSRVMRSLAGLRSSWH